MGKSYDLSKKSDMRRLAKDVEKKAYQIALEKIQKDGLDYECPDCSTKMKLFPGENTCPRCGKIINLDDDQIRKLTR